MSADDEADEDTWRRNRANNSMTSDDRALVGRDKRITDSERQRHANRYPRGVPVVAPEVPELPPPPRDEDNTSPFELFDPRRAQKRRQSDSVAQLAAQLRRDAPDPYDLVARMAFELTHAKEQDRSANRDLERQVVAAIKTHTSDKISDAMIEDVKTIKREFGTAKWFARIAIGAVLAVGSWVIARTESSIARSATETLRLELVEQAIKQIHQEIRDLRRRDRDNP